MGLRIALVAAMVALTAEIVAAQRAAPAPSKEHQRSATLYSPREAGDWYATRGRHAEALAAYERALLRDDDDAAALLGKGRALLALGRANDAIAPLSAAVDEDEACVRCLVLLGDACAAAGQRERAALAYVEALRLEPNADAARGIDALDIDPFALRYEFSKGVQHADDFRPSETSGPALALGAGPEYAGLGVQLAWYVTPPERGLAIAPYLSFGVQPGDEDRSSKSGPVAGVNVVIDGLLRWVVGASYGLTGNYRFQLYGVTVAERGVYGATLAAGVELMFSTGFFLRETVGVTAPIDPTLDPFSDMEAAFCMGVGFKPW